MTDNELSETLRRRQELFIISKDLVQRSLENPELKAELDAVQEELRDIGKALYQHNHPR